MEINEIHWRPSQDSLMQTKHKVQHDNSTQYTKKRN